jgi:hypothetical protein
LHHSNFQGGVHDGQTLHCASKDNEVA